MIEKEGRKEGRKKGRKKGRKEGRREEGDQLSNHQASIPSYLAHFDRVVEAKISGNCVREMPVNRPNDRPARGAVVLDQKAAQWSGVDKAIESDLSISESRFGHRTEF